MNLLRCGPLIALMLLAACDSSERPKVADERRKECLDKLCDGDVAPKHDMLNEVAFKLNGQWFIGPKKYGNANFGAMAFYWPSKAASGETTALHQAKELVRNRVGGVDNFYDVAIEVFVKTKPHESVARGTYQLLLEEERQGHVTDKRRVRDGLDVWRTHSNSIQETWYIATNLRDPSGDPPTVACRGSESTQDRCTGGFLWRPDITASLRFRATHGPDWPEIYQEITRVLQLLRKA